jgi:two-component system, NtrC family, response regulator AtoC
MASNRDPGKPADSQVGVKPNSGLEQTAPPVGERASLRERVRQAAREIESGIIMQALEQHRWNRRRAAQTLNISYRSLMYKMKHCNLRDGGAADS